MHSATPAASTALTASTASTASTVSYAKDLCKKKIPKADDFINECNKIQNNKILQFLLKQMRDNCNGESIVIQNTDTNNFSPKQLKKIKSNLIRIKNFKIEEIVDNHGNSTGWKLSWNSKTTQIQNSISIQNAETLDIEIFPTAEEFQTECYIRKFNTFCEKITDKMNIVMNTIPIPTSITMETTDFIDFSDELIQNIRDELTNARYIINNRVGPNGVFMGWIVSWH